MYENFYHTPREHLAVNKAVTLSNPSKSPNIRLKSNDKEEWSHANCECRDFIRSMTNSIAKSLSKSNKNCFTPDEYFAESVKQSLKHPKFKEKQAYQKSPGGPGHTNLIVESYKTKSQQIKSNLLKKVSQNQVGLKLRLPTHKYLQPLRGKMRV